MAPAAADRSAEDEAEALVEASGDAATLTGEGDLLLPCTTLAVGPTPLLRDARLVLTRAHRYGLVGQNGCGKTLLLKALAAKRIPGLERAPLRIAYVAQEELCDAGDVDANALDRVLSGDERLPALEAELEALESSPEELSEEAVRRMEAIMEEMERLDAGGLEGRARALAAELGLSERQLAAPLAALSGGMRTRVELARALLGDFDVLLLDEPTNHLDLEAVLWLETYLVGARTTVVVVSHDALFLDNVCTDIVQMHGQTLITTTGNYSTFEEHTQEQVNWQTGMQEKLAKKQEKMKAFIEDQRARALAGKTDDNKLRQANSRADKKLDRLSYFRSDGKRYKLFSVRFLGAKWVRYPQRVQQLQQDPSLRFKFSDPADASRAFGNDHAVIALAGAACGYPCAAVPVLQDVTLEVSMSSRVALVGRNGSGKSTLLKLLSGEIEAAEVGQLTRVAGIKVGVVSQHHIEALKEHLHQNSVEYLLEQIPELKNEYEARQFLGGFGLSHHVPLLPIRALSGGLKARLVFALVMWHRPSVLLLDEPTNHLDFESIEALAVAVAAFDGAVVVVSHNSGFLCTCCNELWVVDEHGRIAVTRTSEALPFEDAFAHYRGEVAANTRAGIRLQKTASVQTAVTTAAF